MVYLLAPCMKRIHHGAAFLACRTQRDDLIPLVNNHKPQALGLTIYYGYHMQHIRGVYLLPCCLLFFSFRCCRGLLISAVYIYYYVIFVFFSVFVVVGGFLHITYYIRDQ